MDKRTKGTRKVKGGGAMIAGESRVPVEWADGKTRYIKYTMRAIGTLENCYPQRDADGHYTGSPATPIGEILRWSKPESGMAWSLLANFLWVGLLHEYPGLTREDIEDWLDASRVPYYDECIGKALKIALGSKAIEEIPDAEAATGEDEGKKEELTGTS